MFVRMRDKPTFDFSHLTPAERIDLAEELWDSLTPEELDAEFPLTDEQRTELDRRLADFEQNPGSGVPWEQVRAEIDERLQQSVRERKRRGE